MLIYISFCVRNTESASLHIFSGSELVSIIDDHVTKHVSGSDAQSPEGIGVFVGGSRIEKQAQPQGDYGLFQNKQVFKTGSDLSGVVDNGSVSGTVIDITELIITKYIHITFYNPEKF